MAETGVKSSMSFGLAKFLLHSFLPCLPPPAPSSFSQDLAVISRTLSNNTFFFFKWIKNDHST